MNKHWYKSGWSLEAKNHSWTEDSENQVDFIIKTLQLNGNERILDLACGYGRHALAFARRGYAVTGVDITRDYIDDATKHAPPNAQFICADIRDTNFNSAFDVVLSLADGAIGYLETDEENLKIFDVIAKALKPGGRHFMDVCNAEHAEAYFPKRHWELGEQALSLAIFDWNPATRRMRYGGGAIPWGEPAQNPAVMLPDNHGIRLYSKAELHDILHARGMEIENAYCNYYGAPDTAKELQLMLCSRKISTPAHHSTSN
jgi:SAM-dependent methyltransferase